ncbi:MAG: hypothetical protein IJL38_07225 [Bacteroidales bacterium]|nr:hypothetical protein [Bacteroidales bacterium]
MKINIKSYIPIFLIGLSIVLYIAGVFFINSDTDPLLRTDIAQQKEYTYEDSDGEEHEDVSLIKIQGIGKILCYRDVYKLSVTFWLVALVVGTITFGFKISTQNEIKYIIFTNCIIGAILIYIATKDNIIPTIFFWSGIIVAYISTLFDE